MERIAEPQVISAAEAALAEPAPLAPAPRPPVPLDVSGNLLEPVHPFDWPGPGASLSAAASAASAQASIASFGSMRTVADSQIEPPLEPIEPIGASAAVLAPASVAPVAPGYPVGPSVAPAAPLAEVASAGPLSPVVPITYAPAEPAPNETHLTPEEPSELAEYISQPGCPHPLFFSIKRWSPAFLPSLEGAAALALALMLIFRGAPVVANVVAFGGISTLLAIYLAGGALFGLILYFANSDSVWYTTLVLGAALFPALIFLPLFGWIFGGAELVAALALGGFFLALSMHEVPDSTVYVSKLFGRYFRIVRSGRYLRLPLERVVAALDTGDHIYTTPTQYTEVTSLQGTPYRAHAACTAMYAVLPAEAHRVVPIMTTWERDLQRLLVVTLRDTLSDWATHVTVTGAPPPAGTLARSVLQEARTWAHLRGIWIMRVRVHNIWLEPVSEGPWANGAGYSGMVSAAPAGYLGPALSPASNAALAGSAPLPVARPSAPAHGLAPSARSNGRGPSRGLAAAADRGARVSSSPRNSVVAVPSHNRGRRTAGDGLDLQGEQEQPEGANGSSPEVLAAAYEAVRDGRISDPVTIRGIAQAFARAANRTVGDGAFPYDAAAAARILWEYADQLEQRVALSAPAR